VFLLGFNATGSIAQTPQSLATSTAYTGGDPALTHDGLSPLVAYVDSVQLGVHLAVPGADSLLFTEPTANNSIVVLSSLNASSSGLLTLGWTFGPYMTQVGSFKLQRFSARSSATSVSVTPLHDAIDITGTA